VQQEKQLEYVRQSPQVSQISERLFVDVAHAQSHDKYKCNSELSRQVIDKVIYVPQPPPVVELRKEIPQVCIQEELIEVPQIQRVPQIIYVSKPEIMNEPSASQHLGVSPQLNSHFFENSCCFQPQAFFPCPHLPTEHFLMLPHVPEVQHQNCFLANGWFHPESTAINTTSNAFHCPLVLPRRFEQPRV